ncbi:PQQ-binding-like beta-propeller repeat protein [Natronorubrum sp. JWXQ-INN-674]|uniref:PQQ-binding-like beta-propeller repeat protein n=1 Tax=Natronorubrum halalkaliphilum TaxID=2691917 RepID=A0A6B0VPU4_9EURY|nr:PQQ-binding-like beta-propeller repeat protein [Natronorubrum halalkaliphilum]MXV63026.1 PQQ-binding-like beta-propeller repeat protein [Natronorubrum halalkaliphilum]
MPSRRRLLAGVGATAVALTGTHVTLGATNADRLEWPMARYDPAGTGHSPDASGPRDDVEVAWQETNSSMRMHRQTAPILVGETLYAVGHQSVVAFDRDIGEIRFGRDGHYWSSPARATARAYRSDTLAVTGREGIYGLSASGGYEALGWSIGTERWHSHGQEGQRWSGFPPQGPSPVATNESVYAVVPDSDRVAALDASSGRIRWEQTVGKPRSTGSHRPAVRDETVYVSSRPGDVVAFDAETGDRHWSVTPEPHAKSALNYRNFRPPTVTEAGLVVPDREGVVLLDRTDGSVRWEYTHDGNAIDGSAAVADGTVFVTDGRGSLHAIDLEHGEQEWTVDHSHGTDPVVADGVVYLGNQATELVAIDAQTGNRRWTYEDATYFRQPIVGDGVLYVVVDEGLLALEEAT